MLNLISRMTGIVVLSSLSLSSQAAFELTVTPGDQQLTVQWTAVKKASNYGVCYATESIDNIRNCENYAGGTWPDTPKTSLKITGLTNGTKYYFRVLAENPQNILDISQLISAVPNKIITPKTSVNDTGITASQCYQRGSNSLVACNSAAAKALNPAQDGMIGRDVTASTNSDGHLGFNFTKLSSTGSVLSATASSWACVKDNVTGLIWENKTNDGGLHDGDNTYTNYSADYGAGNLGSASDASGYVATANQQGWCDSKAWRLPTIDELQSLVDYSLPYPGPTIDTAFFPNTQAYVFWSSSPYVGDPNDAWYVDFNGGGVDSGSGRSGAFPVRLVRASQ